MRVKKGETKSGKCNKKKNAETNYKKLQRGNGFTLPSVTGINTCKLFTAAFSHPASQYPMDGRLCQSNRNIHTYEPADFFHSRIRSKMYKVKLHIVEYYNNRQMKGIL